MFYLKWFIMLDVFNFVLQILGPEELIFIIFIIVILIWGPSQLPKLARALGQAKREFHKAQEDEEEEEEEEVKKKKKKKASKTKKSDEE